ALSTVSDLLRNVRTLAVHAANTGVNDQVAVQADQTQISSAVQSIERIAEQTQFGNKNLLDGTSGTTASVVDTKAVAGASIGSTFGGVSTQSGPVTITVNNAATRAQAVGTATYASINASISTVNGTTTGSGGSIVLNGQSISVSGSDTVQTLINKINNLSGSTGVSANFTFGNGSGSVVLTQQSYGGNYKINEAESANLVSTGATNSLSATGLNATITVQAQTLVNGAVQTTSSTFVGGRSSTDSGLRATDNYGNSILLTEAGNTTATSNDGAATVTAGAVQFQVGANAGQTVSTSLGNIRTTNLGNTSVAGSNLSLIDVTTATGANNALKITDEAIGQVSQLRANLGAFQTNTLDTTVQYLGVGVENLQASTSQIRDTNVAAEVVNLTKNQIIQQAATSVLAQANSAPQQVLALLR
ncbi:MAG TPA: flagellin, partial [Chthonomonadaceae bacterium]|nr:flagellin [Chthonomonadaceae bacterium]